MNTMKRNRLSYPSLFCAAINLDVVQGGIETRINLCGDSEAFGAGDIVPSFNAGYWADRNPIRSYMYVDQGPALFST